MSWVGFAGSPLGHGREGWGGEGGGARAAFASRGCCAAPSPDGGLLRRQLVRLWWTRSTPSSPQVQGRRTRLYTTTAVFDTAGDSTRLLQVGAPSRSSSSPAFSPSPSGDLTRKPQTANAGLVELPFGRSETDWRAASGTTAHRRLQLQQHRCTYVWGAGAVLHWGRAAVSSRLLLELNFTVLLRGTCFLDYHRDARHPVPPCAIGPNLITYVFYTGNCLGDFVAVLTLVRVNEMSSVNAITTLSNFYQVLPIHIQIPKT